MIAPGAESQFETPRGYARRSGGPPRHINVPPKAEHVFPLETGFRKLESGHYFGLPPDFAAASSWTWLQGSYGFFGSGIRFKAAL